MKDYLTFLKNNQYSHNTIATYHSILNVYSNHLQDINKVKEILTSYFIVPNTAWTHYNVLSSYYKWKEDDNHLELSKLRLPKIPLKYMDSFTKEYLYEKTDINFYDSEMTRKKKIIIRFLFETGIRISELTKIHNINNDLITILGKGNKIREIFHNTETTNQLPKIEFTNKTIRLWVKQILGKQFTPHSIRRSFATHMLTKGANPKMVMLQLGHEKVETTYRYLQLSVSQNKQIYNKFF